MAEVSFNTDLIPETATNVIQTDSTHSQIKNPSFMRSDPVCLYHDCLRCSSQQYSVEEPYLAFFLFF